MVKDDSQRKILKWIELNAKEDTVHKMWLDPDKPLWRWKQMALDASTIQKKKGLKINSLSFPERKLQKKNCNTQPISEEQTKWQCIIIKWSLF